MFCSDGMTERRKEGERDEGGGVGAEKEGVRGGGWGQKRKGRVHDTLVVTVRCHVIFSSVFLAVSVSLVLHADPKN